MLEVCARFKKVKGHVCTWANAEKEWKTLQEILQGDAEDRRRILYFRDVAVGWMEATDVDVLSRVGENEIFIPERDDSGRLMNRRPCPKPPEGFEWQAEIKLDRPQKRFQQPPDITDLAARPLPEHKPTAEPADTQQAFASARQLPHPRYTNVAEPSDKHKVEVLRVKKSDIACNINASIVKKRPSSSWTEEPLTK